MEALEHALGPVGGSAVVLDGGITNRNVKLRFGSGTFVVRVYGVDTAALGIDRVAEVQATQVAHALGFAPEVVLFLPEFGCVVTRWVEGRPAAAADVREPAVLRRVASALRRFHAGPPLPTRFDAFRLGERYRDETLARGGTVPESFFAAKSVADRIEAVLHHPEHAPVPCHNDLLSANVLIRDDDTIMIVDWEYTGLGDRYFDLGNLAVNNALGEDDERRLLEAYWDEPPDRRRQATLALMRILSDYREGTWGMVQTVLSDLDFDYSAYAEKHLARLLEAADDGRLERWLDAAAA